MHQFKKKIYIILASVITMILSFYLKVHAEFPSHVMFTNARGTKFTVSWTTENIEIGKVKLGKTLDDYSNWIEFNDDRGSVIDDIHHVTISNIIPLTNYYFEIISGGTIDNNGGLFYSINPGPALSPLGGSCQPAGMVYKDKKKSMLALDSIVYVKILGESEGQNSAIESVLITSSSNGYWFLDLINFRTKNLQNYYSFECGSSLILVEAQGGADGYSQMVIKAEDFKTKVSPDIIILSDIIPPQTIITGSPSSPTNLTEVNLYVNGTDVIAYQYKINNNSYSSEIDVADPIYISLTETEYIVSVIGKDSAGNWQAVSDATSVSWTVDITPPTTMITGSPSTPTNITEVYLSVIGPDVIAYQYKINNNSYSSEIDVADPIHISLTETEYIVSVIGKDSAGNWQAVSDATSVSWTVDFTSPTVTIAGTPSSPTNLTEVTLYVNGADVKAYQYKINNNSYSSEIDVADPIHISLTETEYIVSVIGKDSAGNWQAISNATSVSWTVDFTPPTAIISGIPSEPYHLTEIHLTIEGYDISVYKYKINNDDFSEEISIETPLVINITETEYTITVIGKDSAGNWQLQSEATVKSFVFPSETQYIINATSDENGMITPSNTIIVDEFDSINFSIIPNKGYSIYKIFVDDQLVDCGSVYRFTDITTNHVIHATFRPIYHAISGTCYYTGSQTGSLRVEAFHINQPEIAADQKVKIWSTGINELSFKLQVPVGAYHLRAYIDSEWAFQNQKEDWEASGDYVLDIVVDEGDDLTPRNILLSDPESPYQTVFTSSDVLRGQPGKNLSFHLFYNTSNANSNLDGIGLLIHYDSNVLQFDNFSNPYTDTHMLYDTIETSNEDDSIVSTDRIVSIRCSGTNSWPGKKLPIRIGTANFVLNDQLEYGDTSVICITPDFLHPGYQLYTYPITLKIVPFNLDIDCNGEVTALTDGLLILRYLFGFSEGESLTGNANGLDLTNPFLDGIVDTVKGTCITEEQIVENIKNLMPQ